MKYTARPRKRRWPRRLLFITLSAIVIILVATFIARRGYQHELGPENVHDDQVQLMTISSGESTEAIAQELQTKGVIHSAEAFELYVSSKQERDGLEAGTYNFSPSESVQEIVSQLTHGKIAADLVTILPGQRLSQIEQSFMNDGYSSADVSAAFNNTAQYDNEPIMSVKPASASLEGLLFPDSFQKDASTALEQIIRESLTEMNGKLTPSIRSSFASEGLSPYQGLVLASVVEQEVSSQPDRNQVAQVFLSRLSQGMPLGSDVTAYYGAIVAGQAPSVSYNSPYNTLINKGLPPTPISSVSESSIEAVAHPAKTAWLYFVTGDNGITYFSKTLAQHEALTQQYCHKLCSTN